VNTLREYEVEIDRLVALTDKFKSRKGLRFLSQEIRRKLWRDRDRAKKVAALADEAATRLECENPDMLPTRPLPRFEAVYQGGIWASAIQ
jgi:hypothetical protein